MGIATYPAAAGGGIKSVQRGSAGGAGNVTITAVDITKSFVTVFGTTSSGTVSSSFSMSAANTPSTTHYGMMPQFVNSGSHRGPDNSNVFGSNVGGTGVNNYAYAINQNINATNYNISGGSNNLVSAVVQGYLSNSTTLVVSGACRWEVVEFN